MECPKLDKIELLLDLKEELKAAINSRTSWGKNQLGEVIDTIIDSKLREE